MWWFSSWFLKVGSWDLETGFKSDPGYINKTVKRFFRVMRSVMRSRMWHWVSFIIILGNIFLDNENNLCRLQRLALWHEHPGQWDQKTILPILQRHMATVSNCLRKWPGGENCLNLFITRDILMGSKMMETSISMTESMMMMMTFILRMNFTYELVLADDFGHKQARSEGVKNLFTQSVPLPLYFCPQPWGGGVPNLQIHKTFGTKINSANVGEGVPSLWRDSIKKRFLTSSLSP